MTRASNRHHIVECLHRTRLEPYLDAANQNERNALALYQWNVQLTAAFQELLSVTEVILRNAMDRELQEWNNNENGVPTSWLLHPPARPLRSLSQGKRLDAIRLANNTASKREATHRRHGHPVTHDDVLAQVMFGLWKDLLPNHVDNAGDATSNSNRARMWNEALINAFPNVADPSGEVTFWRVARLHGLRNRVSHMENLLGVDVPERTRDIFDLVGSISEPARDWATGLNRVTSTYRSRPGAS